MTGVVSYPHSLVQFSSLPKSVLGKPFVSVAEIAARPLFANRERTEWLDEDNDPRGLSPNKEAILDLFRRIQSSISKGETTSSRKRNVMASDAESVLNVLHQSTVGRKGKAAVRKGDKLRSTQKDRKKKEEDEESGLKPARLPSNFTKRSPIPLPQRDGGGGLEIVDSKRGVESLSGDENEPHNHDSFEEMKLHQLKQVAKLKGIKGYSKLRKNELVELLVKSTD